jgi:hypothetical protein
MDKRKIGEHSRNHCWCGKEICVKHFECVCVCSLRYPECNVHMPYCHLQLYHIFPHYHTSGTIFGKKSLNTKCVCFYFLNNFCLKKFHSKNSVRYYSKCMSVFMSSTGYSCQTLLNLLNNFCNILNVEFHDTPSGRSTAVPCGRWTDTNDKADTCFFFFYRCTAHSEIYIVHSPTNALFNKLGTV